MSNNKVQAPLAQIQKMLDNKAVSYSTDESGKKIIVKYRAKDEPFKVDITQEDNGRISIISKCPYKYTGKQVPVIAMYLHKRNMDSDVVYPKYHLLNDTGEVMLSYTLLADPDKDVISEESLWRCFRSVYMTIGHDLCVLKEIQNGKVPSGLDKSIIETPPKPPFMSYNASESVGNADTLKFFAKA